jgi:hypothetical protein
MIRRILCSSFAAMLFVGVIAGQVAAAPPHWTIVPSPNIGDDENGFADVARIPGTRQLWAVGSGTDLFDETPFETLIARWNGHAWSATPSPNIGPRDNRLNGVSARSSGDAWAVGSHDNAVGIDATSTLRWDGHDWTAVPSPNPGPTGSANVLTAVALFSGADAWAVGWSIARGTLALHWDGSAWHTVAVPDVAGSSCRLDGIVGVPGSGRRVAVGSCADDATGFDRTLVERWTGTAWRIVQAPSPGDSAVLTDVTAVSGSELWAVGTSIPTGASSTAFTTLTMRWNGRTWSRIPSPNAPAPADQTTLLGVSSVPGTGSVWAVGYSLDTSVGSRTYSQRWDGTAWSVVATPSPSGFSDGLSDVVGRRSGDAWTVGGGFDEDAEVVGTLTEHYA